MKVAIRQSALFLAAAFFAGACGYSAFNGGEGTTAPVDILVVPPASSQLPAQIFRDVPYAVLADGIHDLELSVGSPFTGLVTTSAGLPIENAAVSFTLQGTQIGLVQFTDSSGQIAVPLGSGTYDIQVTPDAANLDYYGIPPRIFRDVEVAPGDGPVNKDFVMLPGSRIRGFVNGTTGSPLIDWRVSAREAASGSPSTSGETSALGFEIFVSSTGNWIVQATPPQGATSYPVAEQEIFVGPSDPTLFDFNYPSFDTYALSGKVNGGAGSTVSFAGVSVRARAQLSSPDPDVTFTFDQKTFTDANGNFSIDVLAGVYSLFLEPVLDIDHSHRVLTAIDVSSATPLAEASTQLFPRVDIGGRAFSSAGGEGSRDALVRLYSNDGTAFQFVGTTGDNGNYMVRMDLGEYNVLVLPAPDSGLVRSASTYSATESSTDVDFPLSTGHKVRGRIYGPAATGHGPAIPDAKVVAMDPFSKVPVGSAESVTDDAGQWALTVPIIAPAMQ